VLLFPKSASRLQRQIRAGKFKFIGHVTNDHLRDPPTRSRLSRNRYQSSLAPPFHWAGTLQKRT
jgi:hypothetical protein